MIHMMSSPMKWSWFQEELKLDKLFISGLSQILFSRTVDVLICIDYYLGVSSAGQ